MLKDGLTVFAYACRLGAEGIQELDGKAHRFIPRRPPCAADRRGRYGNATPGWRARRLVSPDCMIDHVSRAAQFERYDARFKRFVRVDPPWAIAATVLSREGEWGF
jgi:hypothetical protein